MLPSRKVVLLGLVLLGLSACAPAVSQQPTVSFEQTPAMAQQSPLVKTFQGELDRLGIQVKEASAYQYTGTEKGAFQSWIVQVYRANPGFCPIRQGFFTSASNDKVFMTILAKGTLVRVLIYDQSAQPHLNAMLLSGETPQPLEISGTC